MPLATDNLFATVAVDQPVDSAYTYSVPPHLRRNIQVGSRVTVPLGRGNRLEQATVLELTDTLPAPIEKLKIENEPSPLLFDPASAPPAPPSASTSFALKPIADILLDVLPIPADLLDLAKWISTYYCAPIGMTIATMVPAAVKRGTRLPALTLISLANPGLDPAAALEGKKFSPKTKAHFLALHAFLQAGPKNEQEALSHAQIARPALKRLLDLGLLQATRQIKLPDPHPTGASPDQIENGEGRKWGGAKIENLTDDQTAALAQLNPLLEKPTFAVRLIHGVTGSGKTELYIRAIEKIAAQGKRAIVLVPEISLTPQTVRRFTARFPRVAVLHSGLKDSERHQHWHAIATGWAQVIVGARSAIFAPASDIGLIIVDEEHDPSYKQDSLPKYHGRDVAIRRAQMLNIPVLLGSATPALESWHNAHHNPHWGGTATGTVSDGGGPISLRSRPLGTEMPRVTIVDMKAEAKVRRGLHILSTTLEGHLKATLEKKKQAIFLLNRRGYAHYLMCPRCDWVLMCPNCDATMVVHRTRSDEPAAEELADPSIPPTASPTDIIELRKAQIDASLASTLIPTNRRRTTKAAAHHHAPPITGTVQCHYCLTSMVLPQLCPLCQARLTHLGQGTQRAEDELLRKFPELRLKRMDSDSMTNLAEYQRTLDAFGRGDLDLLIGTQMLSKGLDFPNVALVGVLNSDLAMTIPDFRAAERTFQLICQVAGRAGRSMGGAQGTVVVQTFQPQEPAIAYACRHDYLGFVLSELPHRKEFAYPPYGRLVRILLSHKSFAQVHAAADELIRLLSALTQKLNLPIRVHGPIPPPMERVMEQYRVEIVLFSDSALPLQRLLASLRARGALQNGRINGLTLSVDVDPLHML
jgi:primosomal protein N' (replication factor Y)